MLAHRNASHVLLARLQWSKVAYLNRYALHVLKVLILVWLRQFVPTARTAPLVWPVRQVALHVLLDRMRNLEVLVRHVLQDFTLSTGQTARYAPLELFPVLERLLATLTPTCFLVAMDFTSRTKEAVVKSVNIAKLENSVKMLQEMPAARNASKTLSSMQLAQEAVTRALWAIAHKGNEVKSNAFRKVQVAACRRLGLISILWKLSHNQ